MAVVMAEQVSQASVAGVVVGAVCVTPSLTDWYQGTCPPLTPLSLSLSHFLLTKQDQGDNGKVGKHAEQECNKSVIRGISERKSDDQKLLRCMLSLSQFTCFM